MLIIDGVKYNLYVPRDEKELETMVKEHFADIFGENSLYFDIKPDLRSKAGIGSKPDGIVVSFDKRCFYVVEIEMAGHPVHDHVIAQITRFNTAFRRSPETRVKITEAIYNEIISDPFKETYSKTKVKGELFKFLTEVFSATPTVVLIIDETTEELNEAVEGLPLESRIVEFKTFAREGVGLTVHAHLFEPLTVKEKTKEKRRLERSEPYKSWEKRLEWVNEETRNLAKELIQAVENKFPDVQHFPRFRWYCFYKGQKRSLNSLFAVLMLTKKDIKVRIKTESGTFKDERNWTKPMKGWFFSRKLQEREFTITEKQQIPYALGLITQSYNISQ
jgi:predicted transport protein